MMPGWAHDTAENSILLMSMSVCQVEPILLCSSNACIIVNVSIFDNSESISLSWSVLSVFTINRDIVTSLYDIHLNKTKA